MSTKAHWEALFKERQSDEVSWYQPHLRLSMQLFARSGASASSRVIDIGGGDSTLVDDLLAKGIHDVTVLDISSEALLRAKNRLGAKAGSVKWVEADVAHVHLPSLYYDVWHDRAVFHFLVNPEQRAAYTKILGSALRPSGHVIMATFAHDGPTRCSGLPTMRYSPRELLEELGPLYELIEAEQETHRTPSGAEQRFVYCLLQRRTDDHSA
ncbi:MAG: methyltransferase domain-containing protein [Anaerolineales bacterium]|nr:methyltransferase domain-containing protein [Anaerolineales bacterium]